MKKGLLTISAFGATFLPAALALAEGEAGGGAAGAGLGTAFIGLAAGLAVGIAAFGSAFGQGRAAATALEGIARNPSAAGKLQVPMILGLAFMEALTILAFVIANSLVGKL